eukprot:CAMPEP_0195064402 /NCGR_PEP_ID=MMETSP0448-20130528/10461_1 /TAXON_ID=66468 /ORGANISM="Heterocapsa triquestra, Strain CCMP 448" /LENGTH=252 /DNA_ID=CAMNT_0040095407 /DNA_START=80 /DNA_END=838 /DNA_ORIENTATION=-
MTANSPAQALATQLERLLTLRGEDQHQVLQQLAAYRTAAPGLSLPAEMPSRGVPMRKAPTYAPRTTPAPLGCMHPMTAPVSVRPTPEALGHGLNLTPDTASRFAALPMRTSPGGYREKAVHGRRTSATSTTSTDAGSSSTASTDSDGEGEWEGITTVKIENLPRRCSQEELLAACDAAGFAGTYNYFFMPRGPCSKQNHGHAFMNFKDPADAHRFHIVMSGRQVRSKCVSVVAASVQGLERNVERFWRASRS